MQWVLCSPETQRQAGPKSCAQTNIFDEPTDLRAYRIDILNFQVIHVFTDQKLVITWYSIWSGLMGKTIVEHILWWNMWSFHVISKETNIENQMALLARRDQDPGTLVDSVWNKGWHGPTWGPWGPGDSKAMTSPPDLQSRSGSQGSQGRKQLDSAGSSAPGTVTKRWLDFWGQNWSNQQHYG